MEGFEQINSPAVDAEINCLKLEIVELYAKTYVGSVAVSFIFQELIEKVKEGKMARLEWAISSSDFEKFEDDLRRLVIEAQRESFMGGK